jgi:hypothetical protein
MLVHPEIGDLVQVWYRRAVSRRAPLHGRVGRIVQVAGGPGPRNHGVRIAARVYAVPCGNLRPSAGRVFRGGRGVLARRGGPGAPPKPVPRTGRRVPE